MPVVTVSLSQNQGLPPLIRMAARQASHPLIIVDHRQATGEVRRTCAIIRRALPSVRILTLGPAEVQTPLRGNTLPAGADITLTLIDEGPHHVLHCPARGDLRASPSIEALTTFVHQRQALVPGASFVVLSALPGAKTEAILEGLRTQAGDPAVQVLTCGTDGIIGVDETAARGGFAVIAFDHPVALPQASGFGRGQDGNGTDSQAVFYRTVIEEMADGICLVDPCGTILYENMSGNRIRPWMPSAQVGVPLASLFPCETEQRQVNDLLLGLLGRPGEEISIELSVERQDGGEGTVQLTLRNCLHSLQIRAIIASLKDITALKDIESRLRTLVTVDDLTGVASRRHFLEKAHREMARARRHRRPLSMLLLDLDYFKRINDHHGHAAGDAVLRGLGDACRATLRREEIIGRMGGEEFAALLPETNHQAAFLVAERLRRAISTSAPIIAGVQLPVTASVGIAEFDPRSDDLDALLARADEALYCAKREGRNRATFAAKIQVA